MTPLASVAVVTDSAAGIPPALLKKYHIGVIPFGVRVGAQSFLDGIDIEPEAFFRLLRAGGDMLRVGTAVPSTSTFLSLYQRLSTWAKGIVSIHLAGAQSATCDAARLAARECAVPVEVVDSETTAMAQGFVVLEAARAAAAGATLADVAARARDVVPCVDLVALLENAGYAVRGGRLAGAARLLGTLLRVQPLVRVSQNKVSLAGQVRRRRSGLAALVESVTARVGEAPVHLTVHYAEDETEGRTLLDRLAQKVNCVEQYLTRIPVALGVHAGPGSLGVAYYAEGKAQERRGLAERLPWRR